MPVWPVTKLPSQSWLVALLALIPQHMFDPISILQHHVLPAQVLCNTQFSPQLLGTNLTRLVVASNKNTTTWVCVCVCKCWWWPNMTGVFFPASRPEFSQKPGRGRGRPPVRATVANFIPDQTNFHISCSGRPLLGSSSHTLIHEYTHNWHGNGCNLLLQKNRKKNFKGWVTPAVSGWYRLSESFRSLFQSTPSSLPLEFPFFWSKKKKRKHLVYFAAEKKEEISSEEDLKRGRRVS